MAIHKLARKQGARKKPTRKTERVAPESRILFASIVYDDTFPGLGIAGDVTRSEAARVSLRRVEIKVNERKSFVESILRKKGLTINEWAVKSGVDHHSAKNYMNGKRKTYPSTRKKLAASLDLDPDSLPL